MLVLRVPAQILGWATPLKAPQLSYFCDTNWLSIFLGTEEQVGYRGYHQRLLCLAFLPAGGSGKLPPKEL